MTARKNRANTRRPKIAKESKGRTSNSRRRALLDAAARLFGERGYDGTSTRDIASEVGMLAGSIYYHFRSKQDLLLAVHEEVVRNVLENVESTLRQVGADPWDRLEAACVAHLESLLGGSPYTGIVMPHFTAGLPERLRRTLIAQRDSYEAMFSRLVDDLPLSPQIDRRYFRLALLGSLNWTLTWYHAGRDSPATIVHQFVQVYRLSQDLVPAPRADRAPRHSHHSGRDSQRKL